MPNPSNTTIQLIVGDTKHTIELRLAAGVKITAQAPQSPLYLAHSDLKASADELNTQNAVLKSANEGYHTALAALVTARGVQLSATTAWDGAFDVFMSTSAKYCVTEEDAAKLALAVRTGGKNPLAMPLAVAMTYNPKKDSIRVHVKRAPGMDVVVVEVTTDLTNPTSWKELDGWGAIHLINHPAPATWWARAASKTAHAKSDYTTPVSVIVK